MIRENYKKVGIFNLLLIALVVIYDSVRLITSHSLITRVVILVHFVAYFVGILYALSEYKKDGAKYYKMFMFLVVVSEAISFVGKLTRAEASTITTVLSVVCIVLTFVLALVKNLGNKLSILLCSTCLAIHLFNLIHTIIFAPLILKAISGPLSNFALIVLALVFVIAKYEDKALRNSK